MAILDILIYPDPRLRQIADPVTTFDGSLQSLVKDMLDTMYAASGIGLAATQVNIRKQIIIIDVSPDQSDTQIFINPTITASDGDSETEEGCLSLPGIYASVHRHEHIRVQAMSVEGQSFEREANGLLALCIQHEMDHLKGKVFVDYLSRLKQERIRKRLKKEQREKKQVGA